MKPSIVEKRDHALRLSLNSTTFWIQRRWLRKDGTLTPKGQAAYREACVKVSMGGNSNSRFLEAYVERSTVSALLINTSVKVESREPTSVSVWLPKSAIIAVGQRGDLLVTAWGFRQIQMKSAELLREDVDDVDLDEMFCADGVAYAY